MLGVHSNSKESLKSLIQEGTRDTRLQAVIDVVKHSSSPLRDSDVLEKLFPGQHDLNLVRPRITEAHELGILVEGPQMANIQRTRNVRTSIFAEREIQMRLL